MNDLDNLFSSGSDNEGTEEQKTLSSNDSAPAVSASEIDAVVKNADVMLYQTLHAGDKVLAEDGAEWVMASTNEILIRDEVVVEHANHDEESE
jgi:hypothetical protein